LKESVELANRIIDETSKTKWHRHRLRERLPKARENPDWNWRQKSPRM